MVSRINIESFTNDLVAALLRENDNTLAENKEMVSIN